MKKLALTLAFFSALTAFAQKKTSEEIQLRRQKEQDRRESIMKTKDMVSFYPFSMIGSNFMVGYEHVFSNKLSGKIMGSFGFADESNYYGISNYSSSYGEIQLRYFADKKGPMGFFIAPYALTKKATFDQTVFSPSGSITTSSTVTAINGGIVGGVQAFFNTNTFMDFYLGGGPMNAKGDYYRLDNGIDPWKRGIAFHMGFSLGLRIR